MGLKRKISVTVDAATLDELLQFTGIERNVSAVIDLALRETLRLRKLARDVSIYAAQPTVDQAWVPQNWSHLADDVDWETEFEDGADLGADLDAA